MRDKAWTQLGTNGSGKHFVEFGAFTVTDDALGIPGGECVAMLSYSGSRGTGAKECDFYSKCAPWSGSYGSTDRSIHWRASNWLKSGSIASAQS